MHQATSLKSAADLLSEYAVREPLYELLCSSVTPMLKALLSVNGIQVHSISSRCKDAMSLERKIKTKDKYGDLAEITDLAGIRVITHYNDDVNRVAEVIDREFLIDSINTVDKRRATDPDRFGYVSLHYVASLSETRANLQENLSIGKLKFEIQIRSILQHTWAEIEHDTGYKVEKEVPAQIRRRFSRLAGLLELADEEFVAIRDALSSYSKEVVETINSENLDVSLDKVSLQAFIENNTLSVSIDTEISEKAHLELVKRDLDVGSMIRRLNFFQVFTVADLIKNLTEYRKDVVGLGVDMSLGANIADRIAVYGASSFYLCHVLAAKSSDDVRLRYLLENGWSDDHSINAEFRALLDRYSN